MITVVERKLDDGLEALVVIAMRIVYVDPSVPLDKAGELIGIAIAGLLAHQQRQAPPQHPRLRLIHGEGERAAPSRDAG